MEEGRRERVLENKKEQRRERFRYVAEQRGEAKNKELMTNFMVSAS